MINESINSNLNLSTVCRAVCEIDMIQSSSKCSEFLDGDLGEPDSVALDLFQLSSSLESRWYRFAITLLVFRLVEFLRRRGNLPDQ